MISEKQMERKYGWKRVEMSSEAVRKSRRDLERATEVSYGEIDQARREVYREVSNYVFDRYGV